MTDSRQRVEVPITKHLEGLVQKGVPPATRTGLFSTPKFSFCDGQPVYLLTSWTNLAAAVRFGAADRRSGDQSASRTRTGPLRDKAG
jgi:hypothetical protein